MNLTRPISLVLLCIAFVPSLALGQTAEVNSHNTEGYYLFLLDGSQQQYQEGSLSVEINHDLIFSPNSPLRLANKNPVKVKFKLPSMGEAVATISEFKFRNIREYSYTGKIESKIGGNLYLTKVGTVFRGDILLNNGVCYELKKIRGVKYSISEIKINQNFQCATCEQENIFQKRKIKKLSGPSSVFTHRHNGYSLQGGDIQVDLLVVYTEAARKKAGNLSSTNLKEPDNHDHIKSLMDRYLNITNAALKSSGVNVKINIVHKEEINYQEADEQGVLEKWSRLLKQDRMKS